MLILIDGYNVLKLVHSAKEISLAARAAFAKQLAAYGKRKGHTIVLVFDGGPYNMSTSERQGQVTTVYVGYRETADDYIKRFIHDHPRRQLLLVTHDRELVNYALNHDVPTIDVWPFYERVHEKESRPTTAKKIVDHVHKLHPEEVDIELDAMLSEADILEKVEYEPVKSREQASKKQSKLQKDLEAILKKL